MCIVYTCTDILYITTMYVKISGLHRNIQADIFFVVFGSMLDEHGID